MLSCHAKQRRPWTHQEDQALVYLKQEMKITKWPQIAAKMVSMFHLKGRTEKQCRDRYVNFLKNVENSYIWRPEDQKKLTELYYEHGNKWSQIAVYFPNTNGIYIKNKFYSRLRRAVRYLNMVIQSYFSEYEKPFSFDIIFKLVNNANNKYRFNQSTEIKELLEVNPQLFEDIIVKLITMTNDTANYTAKKRMIRRISSKNQTMWKKLIEILRFFQKEVDAEKNTQNFQKDFHLETHHHDDFRRLCVFQIQGFLGYPKNCGEQPVNEELRASSQLIEASYIQLKDIRESVPKRRSQIIIISDQKSLCEKKREDPKTANFAISKKDETLSIKETQSPFKRKDISDDKSLVILGKEIMNLMSFQKNLASEF